jgi:hypothetical protein
MVPTFKYEETASNPFLGEEASLYLDLLLHALAVYF